MVQRNQNVHPVDGSADTLRRYPDKNGVTAASDTGHVFFGGKDVVTGPFEHPRKDELDGLDTLAGFTTQYDGNVVSIWAILADHNFFSIKRIVKGMQTGVKENLLVSGNR